MPTAGSARTRQADLWLEGSNDHDAIWRQLPEESRAECLELVARLLRSTARGELQSTSAHREGEQA
jgi:hypothetical protein